MSDRLSRLYLAALVGCALVMVGVVALHYSGAL